MIADEGSPADARAGGADPWAHRRAEPRGIALCWTLYLFATTGIATGSAGLRGAMSIEGMRLAAEMMLVSLGAGLLVLWPLLRLSQSAAPRRGVGWAAGDAVAIALPAQAVIWPQIWLAGWSPMSALAAGATVCAWSALVSGLLALAFFRDRPPRRRAWWMALFLALGVSGPIAWVVSPVATGGLPQGTAGGTSRWEMLSPISALRSLAQGAATSDWGPSVTDGQWTTIGGVAIAGGLAWLVAGGSARRSTGT